MTQSIRDTFFQLLILVARKKRRKANDAAASYGLSAATAEPLLWLGRSGGKMRQGVLANIIGIDGASLTHAFDQLAARGFVEREDDPRDRRAKTLRLTPEGSDLAHKIETALQSGHARILRSQTDEDIAVAVRVLRAIDRELDRDDRGRIKRPPA